MKLIDKLLLILMAAVFACCTSGNSNELADEADTGSSSLLSRSSDGSCLFGYDQKLDQLLTKDMIVQEYAMPDEAEFNYSKAAKGYHKVEYTWPSDRIRKMEVMGRTVDVPLPNQIGIGLMKQYDEDEDALKRFRFIYRNMTEEEIRKAKERMAERLEEYEDKEGKKLTKSQQKVGKGFIDSAMGSTKYHTVDGVGDAAVWEEAENVLIILVGKTQFRVYADVGKDDAQNRQLAEQLASAVLSKCA